MFELKRESSRYLEVKAGAEVFRADLSHGLGKYNQYLKFKGKLEDLSARMASGLEISDETIGYFLALAESFLDCIFRHEDTLRILAFFDNDAEECLEQILPFVMGEYQTALKEEMRKRNERRINEYIQTGHIVQ